MIMTLQIRPYGIYFSVFKRKATILFLTKQVFFRFLWFSSKKGASEGFGFGKRFSRRGIGGLDFSEENTKPLQIVRCGAVCASVFMTRRN
ncbi:MAG: hypothetical protein NZ534_02095, partial [Bacteroidia bacterium]|nr:hypothetical protein [Bacteroidia bacterium]